MGETAHSNGVVAPNPPSDEEVAEQLAASRRLMEEAHIKAQRADQTAGEMARVLRRLARAIESNPQSWDDLFDRGRQ